MMNLDWASFWVGAFVGLFVGTVGVMAIADLMVRLLFLLLLSGGPEDREAETEKVAVMTGGPTP